MTIDQIRWAMYHDWALEVAKDDKYRPIGVRVIDKVLRGGVWCSVIRLFTDFRKLKEWAGY